MHMTQILVVIWAEEPLPCRPSTNSVKKGGFMDEGLDQRFANLWHDGLTVMSRTGRGEGEGCTRQSRSKLCDSCSRCTGPECCELFWIRQSAPWHPRQERGNQSKAETSDLYFLLPELQIPMWLRLAKEVAPKQEPFGVIARMLQTRSLIFGLLSSQVGLNLKPGRWSSSRA